MGGSAGGTISVWLAFHDDMATSDSLDPVYRQSTRLLCAVGTNTAVTYELSILRDWFGCDVQEPASARVFLGIDKEEDLNSQRAAEILKTASPLTYLTPDDPPIYLFYGQHDKRVDENTPPEVWIHHPRFGIKLKEIMDTMGIEIALEYPGSPPVDYYKDYIDFLRHKLLYVTKQTYKAKTK